MTRGQFVIITNNGVFSSCEFNGDMYYEGYGKEAIERLKNVKTVKDFEREVSEFNNENFQYNYDLVLKAQNPIDFSVDYFDNWFSDYLYIKNISNKVNTIVDADGKSWKIKPNEIKVFYFGEPTSIKEKSIKEAKTVTCISCEKNLNDYRNDPTCTQTWDYADGDTKWYQKSIHECIEDAKKFMKKGYLCYIDGELVDKPDVFDNEFYFEMEIKPKSSAKKSIKESKISYKEFQDICEEESNDVVHFHEYKGAYFVILGREKECEKLNDILRDEYSFSTTYYKILDPHSGFNGYFEIMCV